MFDWVTNESLIFINTLLIVALGAVATSMSYRLSVFESTQAADKVDTNTTIQGLVKALQVKDTQITMLKLYVDHLQREAATDYDYKLDESWKRIQQQAEIAGVTLIELTSPK